MARPKDEDLGDDFSYILRMADTDMDGLKPLATALTSVKASVPAPPSKSARTPDLTLTAWPDSSTPTSKSNSASPSNPTPKASPSGC